MYKLVFHVTNLSDIGGAETILLQLLKHADPNRYRFIVGCLNGGGELERRVASLGVPFYNLNIRNRLAFPAMLRSVIQSHPVDIIQTHGIRAELACTRLAKKYGVPISISTTHNVKSFSKVTKVVFHKRNKNYIDCWVSVTHTGAEQIIQKLNVPRKRVCVIPNSVDIKSLSFDNVPVSKQSLGFDPDHFVILNIANLRPVKGHRYILNAIARMDNTTRETIKVCFVGADQYGGRIQNMARRLDVESNVVFTGFCDDVKPYLKIADLYLSASVSEGIPLSLLEAMAAGLPIIATCVGGVPEIINHEENGILIPPKNPAAIKDAIIRLIRNSNKERTLLASKAIVSAEQYSVDSMVERYHKLYEDLLGYVDK